MTAAAAVATYFVAATALLIGAVLLHQRTRRPGPPRLFDPARLPGEPTGEQLRQLYGVPDVGDEERHRRHAAFVLAHCKFCHDLSEIGDPGDCICPVPCGRAWCSALRQQWHTELGDWRAELAALLEEGDGTA